jgi:hypothetical protein
MRGGAAGNLAGYTYLNGVSPVLQYDGFEFIRVQVVYKQTAKLTFWPFLPYV